MTHELDYALAATVDLATTRGQYHRTARHTPLRPSQHPVTAPGEAWRDDALCVGEPSDLFFPDQPNSYAPARQVCARCPVTDHCLDFAEREHLWWGMFGGLSERERAALRNTPTAAPRARQTRCHGCGETFTTTGRGHVKWCDQCPDNARLTRSQQA